MERIVKYVVALLSAVIVLSVALPATFLQIPTHIAHAADIDCNDIGAGLQGGEQVDNQTGLPAPNAEVDTKIYACVNSDQLTLVVEPDEYTKDTTNGSREIAGRIVLFAPAGDDTTHVVGAHELTLYTGSNEGANVRLNVHSSSRHGITSGQYEGAMVCIAFCSATSDMSDPQTYIARNSDECAYNGNTDETDPITDDDGKIMDRNPGDNPCILDPNSWGFKIGAGEFEETDYDYKPLPHESETPYSVINTNTNRGETRSLITEKVSYALSTTRNLRPGVYVATTIYTLTVEV